MYNNYPYYMGYRNPMGNNIYNDRFGGFFVPFLLGGLGGAAVVGLSRPRPVYVNQPYYPNQYYPYSPYGY